MAARKLAEKRRAPARRAGRRAPPAGTLGPRSEALAKAARNIVAQRTLSGTLRAIAREASAVVGTRRCRIYSIDWERGERRELFTQGISPEYLRRTQERWGKSVALAAVERREALAIPDALRDPRLRDLRDAIRKEGFQSLIALPLLDGEKAIGGLSFYHEERRDYTPSDIRLAQAFADHVAVALRNAQLLEESRRQARKLEAVGEVARRANAALDMDTLVSTVANSLRRVVPCARCTVVTYVPERDVASFHLVYQDRPPRVGEGRQIPAEGTATKRALETGQPVYVEDTSRSPFSHHRRLSRVGIRSVFVVPIRAGTSWQGSITFGQRERDGFPIEEREILGAAADHLAIAFRNASLYEETRRNLAAIRRLAESASAIASHLEVEKVLEAAAAKAPEVLKADGCRMVLAQGEGKPPLVCSRGFPPSLARLAGAVGGVREGEGPGRRKGGGALFSPGGEQVIRLPAGMAGRRRARGAFLSLPLSAGAPSAGTLSLFRRDGPAFGPLDLSLARIFAGQVSVALSNARLHGGALLHAEKLEGLSRSSEAIASGLELDRTLKKVVGESLRLLGADKCCVFLREEDGGRWRYAGGRGFSRGYIEDVREHAEGLLINRLLRHPSVQVFEDAPQHARAESHRQVFLRHRIHTVVAAPLLAEGAVIGALNLCYSRPKSLSPEERSLLQAFGHQAAVAIENARLFRQTELSARRFEELARRLPPVTSTLEPGRLAGEICRAVRELAGADLCRIWLMTPDRRGVALSGSSARASLRPHLQALQRTSFRLGEGCVGRVAKTGKAMQVPNVRTSPIFTNRELARAAGLTTLLAVPIPFGGETLGVLALLSCRPRAFSAEEVHLVEVFASHAGVALKNSSLYEELRRRVTRQSVVDEIARAVGATLDLDAIFGTVVEQMRRVVPCRRCAIALYDPDREVVRFRNLFVEGGGRPAHAEEVPARGLGVRRAHRTRKTVHLPDFRKSRHPHHRTHVRIGVLSGLNVPILSGKECLGVLLVGSPEAYGFGPERVELLEAVASHLALAMRNAAEHRATVEQLERRKALARASHRIVSEREVGAALEAIAEEGRRVLGADRCGVYLLEAERGGPRFVYSRGLSPEYVAAVDRRFERIPGGRMMAEKRALCVEDAPRDPRMRAIWPFIRREGYTTVAMAPLLYRGEAIGGLSLYHNERHPYPAGDLDLLQALANQAAVAIENARLHDSTARQLEQLRGLAKAAERVAAELEPKEALRAILREGERVLGADRSVLSIVDPETGARRFAVWRGLSRRYFAGHGRYISRGPAALSLKRRAPVAVTDVARFPLPPGLRRRFLQEGTGAVLNIPMEFRGKPVGVITFHYNRPRQFDQAALDLGSTFASQAAIAIENARLYESARSTGDHLASLIRHAHDLILTLDRAGRIRSWNDEAARLLGLEAGRAAGMSFAALVPAPRRAEFRGLIRRVLRGQEVRNHTLEVLPPGGEPRSVALTLSPILDRGGRISAISAIGKDITEERSTQEQLFQASRLAAIGELAAGVAHELNNPLTGVIGYAELLGRRELPKDVAADVERILQEGQRAKKIVSDLLMFARTHREEDESFRLPDVLGRTARLLRKQLEVNGIALAEEYAPDLPPLYGNAGQVQQVLLNLLQNAHDAILESGRGSRVAIRARALPGGAIEVTVEDDGPGMAEEVRKRIFDPFFTTKPGGTGLGLSVAHRIVRRHGGEFGVQSAPGKGARFTFTLSSRRPAAPRAKAEVARPAGNGGGAASVLVVDDERGVLEVVERVLREGGYRVEGARDAREALRRVGRERYDLILMDLRMPKMTGQALYTQLKRRRPELAARVVFLTGDTSRKETAAFLEREGRPCILKPFTGEELLRSVEDSLGAASG